MTREQVRNEYRLLNAIYGDKHIVFRVNRHRWEVYNRETEHVRAYRTFDEVAADPDAAAVFEQYKGGVLRTEVKGDRTDSSSLFGGQGGEMPGAPGRPDFPSRVNIGNAGGASEMKTLDLFRQLHANDRTESGFAVDERGFVHTYRHGEAHSIGWAPSDLPGMMIYHNHPSGGAFSKQDLVTAASTASRGVVASGRSGDYIFQKTQKFDSVGFQKALDNASTTDSDYNRAVDRWLKRNAKRYGFKYQYRVAGR